MRIKWLHLSDIHFNFKNFNSDILRRDFLERVEGLAKNEGFSHLFLSGDILDKNIDEENDKKTVEFLRALVNKMNIDISNMIVVPGNHDHDRGTAIAYVQGLPTDPEECDKEIAAISQSDSETLLRAFANFEKVYRELFSCNYYIDYTNPHIITSFDGLSIIQLNTAWLDTDSKESAVLRCGEQQLLNLLELNEERLKNTINIAIGHHPLADLVPQEREHILSLFHRFNIGLYFSGHKHKSSIAYDHENDVLQITCPGAYYDGYSTGGYVYGIIDTDSQLYRAEFFKWDNGRWYIDSSLEGTDERGILHFNTKRFKHNMHISAIDFCAIGSHRPIAEIAQSIGQTGIDVYTYPYSNIDMSAINWDLHIAEIRDLALTVKLLIEKGDAVHLFPLAPIPMLIALGFEMQNEDTFFIHQRDRTSGKWVYNEKEEGIDCTIEETINGNNLLVLKVSCSFEVLDKQIHDILPEKEYDLIDVKATTIRPGYPLYHNDIDQIVDSIFDKLNCIISNYNAIHVFAAIPAGMAVEIGRRMLKSVYYNIVTYQLDHRKYTSAIILNPYKESVDITRQRKNVLEIESTSQDIVHLPILGKIACGKIAEAISEPDEHLPLPSSILGSGEHFVITASGDSMVDAGIDDGDLIIVRKQETAIDGDIVVAIDEDGNTTLKRIYHDDKHKKIILKAENPSYANQEFDQLEIQGIAVKVIKNLR